MKRKPPEIIMGAFPGGKLVVDDGDFPVMGIGPTGSGKTKSVLYPTLAAGWSHSAIVWDFKGTINEEIGYARDFAGKVIVFDVRKIGGSRHNLLMEVRDGVDFVPDIQSIAQIICHSEGKGGNRFWDSIGVSFTTGGLAHVLTALPDGEKSLAGFRRFILRGDEAVQEMMHPGAHRIAKEAAQEFWGRSEEEAEKTGEKGAYLRKQIYMTASVQLSEFASEVLDHQTSASDFTFSDLISGPEPVTLFVVSDPVTTRRWRRFFRLWFMQAIDFLSMHLHQAPDGRDRAWNLLVAIDEFLEFHIQEVAEWIKYVREARLRLLLMGTSMEDIDEEYGAGLGEQCMTVRFPPRSVRAGEGMSRAAGMISEEKPTRTVTRRGFWETPTVSVSTRPDNRPRLSADKATRLPPDSVMIFGFSSEPIMAQRVPIYQKPWKDLIGHPSRQTWEPTPGANRWFGHTIMGAEPTVPSLAGGARKGRGRKLSAGNGPRLFGGGTTSAE